MHCFPSRSNRCLAWAGCALLLGLLACAAPGGERERRLRPNVLLVMTDDQGFGDYSHMGHGALETPVLDRLAASCPQVERFYVSPVCSPTRACLLTGRYNYRTRVVDTWIGRSMLEPEEVTLAEMLGSAGYATGIFGKWHLGDCYPMRPMDQGFEESLVHLGGGLAQPSEPPANGRRYTDALLYRNGEEVQTQGYCTDVYFDAAMDFIEESAAAERPFFTYVATNAPHGPFHDVPEDLYGKYKALDVASTLPGKGEQADREARICAMLENIDQNLGRMLAGLEERGLLENTIVVFLSDNGPVPGRYNAGLRGFKTGVHEGGIRTPLYVSWGDRFDAETRVEPIAAHIDLLPTILDMTGVEPPAGSALDGRSLLPLLDGESVPWAKRRLFLQSHRGDVPTARHNFAAVGQRWKLLRASGFGRATAPADAAFELYDLLADPGEQRDLAAQQPAVLAQILADYDAWFADVSSTRPDNFAAPRIVLGSEHAPRTALTRQDWRVTDTQGWSSNGVWKVSVPEAAEFDLHVNFSKDVSVDQLRFHTGTGVFERSVQAAGRSLDLGSVTCEDGSYDLRVECLLAGELVPLHQVILSRR
ncbi:MAG: arylsulfatase A-like enzyme [Planctomycetota bacterium]|jgi:arylsulfatase A-like enzyme